MGCRRLGLASIIKRVPRFRETFSTEMIKDGRPLRRPLAGVCPARRRKISAAGGFALTVGGLHCSPRRFHPPVIFQRSRDLGTIPGNPPTSPTGPAAPARPSAPATSCGGVPCGNLDLAEAGTARSPRGALRRPRGRRAARRRFVAADRPRAVWRRSAAGRKCGSPTAARWGSRPAPPALVRLARPPPH